MKHTTYLILLLTILFPQLVRAQFNSFEPGAYILAGAPTVVQKGELKLRGSDQLVVKTETGQKLKFSPKEVIAFRIGEDKYVAVEQFTVGTGLNSFDVDQAFAKPLDSGAVELLYYEFTGHNYSGSALLLRTASLGTVALMRGGLGASKRFRETVRPFLQARPDFIQYLNEKRINIDNLAEAVHALNHNLPFTPPSALNME